ncbi:M50 family metallopeptidase [Eggerthella sp. YY7918]|uniref:M50 family metallopeptidase n=1 Tax=Eggerthella sp. (strain YY7918) TaxID=502558 RepID=UPI0002170EEB|nr:M50 family metallopeptidase [Eggerthella sp. YY7918]BAK43661.1 hypothetical protein EGYY_04400 [Eggerthella sp. YY7918]
MTKTNTTKSSKLTKALVILLFALIGAFIGYQAARMANKIGSTDMLETVLLVGLFIVAIAFAYLLQIIAHEAGHLVMGLATGYRFVSFRIGSFMLLKDEGRLRLRRFSLAGTGGQCLLGPPDLVDGRVPYVLYNLGGVLANLALAILCGIAAVVLRSEALTQVGNSAPLWITPAGVVALFCTLAAAIGLALALMNGIPLSIGGVDNDGRNIVSASKSPEALRAFWIIVKVSEQQARGIRAKDMPASWFAPPSSLDALKNPVIASVAVIASQRLLDQGNITEAAQSIRALLEAETGMLGIHRALLQIDLAFCELMEGTRPANPEPFDKETQQIAKAMRTNPALLRAHYATALLADHNPEEARALREKFDRAAARYPYPADIASERELMAQVDKVAATQQAQACATIDKDTSFNASHT